jgi:hypothetical protein
VRRKLNLLAFARIKVLSELGMAAGIIMASDGLSGSMCSRHRSSARPLQSSNSLAPSSRLGP